MEERLVLFHCFKTYSMDVWPYCFGFVVAMYITVEMCGRNVFLPPGSQAAEREKGTERGPNIPFKDSTLIT